MQKEISKVKKLPESDNIVFDSTKCTGCKVCELVCSFSQNNVLSPSLARIHIFNDLFFGLNRADNCRQCVSPQCYYVCPVDAIYIDENTGGRILDDEKCNGCGKCAEACPYNKEGFIIRYEPDKKVFIKCDLCWGEPKCVEWCAPKALSYIRRGGG